MTLQIGSRRPLGLGAGGLAILASLPPDEVEEVLSVVMPTIERDWGFPEADLRESLLESQQQAYAVIRNPPQPGRLVVFRLAPVRRWHRIIDKEDEPPAAGLDCLLNFFLIEGIERTCMSRSGSRLENWSGSCEAICSRPSNHQGLNHRPRHRRSSASKQSRRGPKNEAPIDIIDRGASSNHWKCTDVQPTVPQCSPTRVPLAPAV